MTSNFCADGRIDFKSISGGTCRTKWWPELHVKAIQKETKNGHQDLHTAYRASFTMDRTNVLNDFKNLISTLSAFKMFTF